MWAKPFRTCRRSTCNDPGNPNADKQGYIKLPNVNSLVEIMDMREAQKSYEANLNVLDVSKTMMSRTVDLLRQQDDRP